MHPEGRYVELDGLRGIAAGSVVLFHLFREYDTYFQPGGQRPPVQFSLGYFGVHLFFLISGFVILMTARNTPRPRDFVVARFSRLYPTYWVCLTTSWVLILVLNVPALFRSPLEIAVNYSMVQRIAGVRSVDGSYWSLSVELLFYGVVWLLLVAGRPLTTRTVRQVVTLWLISSLVVALAVHARPDDPVVRLIAVLSVAEFAPLFALGMLLLATRGTGRIDPFVLPTVAVGFTIAALLNGPFHATIVTGLSLVFAVVVLLPGCAPLRWRPLVFLGEISYPLYLVHQNVGYAVLNHLVPRVDRTWASVAALFVVTALAWVLHVTVEGPVSRWVRRSLRRRGDRRTGIRTQADDHA